ncbi:hypothetical protein PR202_ga13851 [Eleusine coracana subsp. coracana]|uniref:Bifunctional inhibitor/plant lipid transfer protein/seed storage helical domain-containing protein n=1 Tax=Eleusine coracana subsp. coracana TaxID=191504 RepID=A0AAV5CG01_ELECO|nr:hypothetical protein PR202_ga13851 [Eleusine coracana subsp. coracana]
MMVMMMIGSAMGDFAADRAECADKLMGLATCLTYVQTKATARSPTPDCCAGLKQVVTASKKCLCVLVKDRDEPALGFQINVTRHGPPRHLQLPRNLLRLPQYVLFLSTTLHIHSLLLLCTTRTS